MEELLTFLQGFLTGAAVAFLLVAIWECRELRRSIKKYVK